MRSIDADALIQSLEKKHAHWHELVGDENKEIEFAHSYALNVIRNAPTVEPSGDLISRADTIALLTEIVFDEPPYFDSETLCRLYVEEQINTLPSAKIAETEPIVIRSRTLMPTKDFMEWAKRIKKVNPNAVVIPCDAEVVSAEVAQVVLCKNCRFYDNLCAVCRCPQWDLSRTEYPKVKENDFCSYWEASNED